MRRISIVLISVLIVLLLGGSAYGYVANQRNWWPFGNNSPLTALTNPLGRFVDLVPPETIFYGHFDLNNAQNASTIAGSSQLSASMQVLKRGWDKLITQAQTSEPIPAEAKALFELVSTHEVEVAMIPRNLTGTAKNFGETTSIVAGLTLKPGEDVNQQLVALKGGIKSGLSSNQDMVGTDSTVGTHTVTTIKITDKNTPTTSSQELFLTNLQNQLIVLTSDSTTMTQVLSNSDTSNHPSLSNQTSLPKLQSQLAKDQLAIVYMNGEKELAWQQAITKVTGTKQEPAMESFNQNVQNALANSNLLKYQAIFGISFTSSGLLMNTYTNFADPETAKAYSNSTLVYNTQVPDNTLAYFEIHNVTAPLGMLTPMIEALDQSISSAMNEKTTLAAQFEKATGLNLATDIAPLFQQNSALALVPQALAMNPVSVNLLTQVSDISKAKATMDKATAALIKAFGEGMDPAAVPQVHQESSNGVNITSYVELPNFSSPEAGNPAPTSEYLYNYAIRAKDLLVSSSLETLKSILSPSKPLASATNYPAFLKQANDVNGVSFINVRGIVDLVKPFIINQMNAVTFDPTNPEATPDPKVQTQFESEVMPYLNLVRNISAFSRQENGMVRSDLLIQMVD